MDNRSSNAIDAIFQVLIDIFDPGDDRKSDLDEMLLRSVSAIQKSMAVDGAVIVIRQNRQDTVWFLEACFPDPMDRTELKRLSMPNDLEVIREVICSGLPKHISDYGDGFNEEESMDLWSRMRIRHLAAAPIGKETTSKGAVLIANQKNEPIDSSRLLILQMVGVTLSLAIENHDLRRQLQVAKRRVAHLKVAKDKVIQRFSHELKTPLAVLSASLNMLERRAVPKKAVRWQAVLARAQRNLERLLNMEYELEDILREWDSDHSTHESAKPTHNTDSNRHN